MTTPISEDRGLVISPAPGRGPAQGAAHRPPVHRLPRRTLPSVAVVIGYIVIGAVAFWPVFPLSTHLFGYGGDFVQSLWFLAWVPYAIDHGLNPYFSHAMFVPTGVNLAATAPVPLLGLITAPFALFFSPVERANVLLLLAMPISATAALVVLRKWHVWLPAAALGGLIYGFSPYMVGQATAHLNLVFLPLPPFIALTVESILRHRGSPRRLGVQLGLLLTAQYLISQEMFTIVVILVGVGVVAVSLRYPAQLPEMLRTSWRPVCIAVLITVVLLGYPLWMMLVGPQHITGPTFPKVNQFHNDLFGFVAPGPLQKISLGMRSLGNRLAFDDGASEANGYIGVPVLILTALFAWRSRRSPRMQLAVVLLAVAALLSLGPHLAVNGRTTGFPLPFLLLDHIPSVDSLLPDRFSFGLGACLAAVIAFGLDDVHRTIALDARDGAARRRSGAVFAIITVAVLVATLLPDWPLSFDRTPAIGLPASIRGAVPAGAPVAITYPYATGNTSDPLLWQAEDGFGFQLLGGYSYHPVRPGIDPSILLPSVMNPPQLQQFLAGLNPPSGYGPPLPITPELVSSTRATLSKYHVRLVIVDRSAAESAAVMELFNDALGPPRISSGRFSLWTGWQGIPKRQVFRSFVRTRVLVPADHSALSRTTVLDAMAAYYLPVTKVDFLLSNSSQHSTIIATASPSSVGWLAKWNTALVANGTYSLRSIAYDDSGRSSQSAAITVTVNN